MKFRYYITDMFDGAIKGTNNSYEAANFAACEDYFVVDSEAGEWLTPDGARPVQNIVSGE